MFLTSSEMKQRLIPVCSSFVEILGQAFSINGLTSVVFRSKQNSLIVKEMLTSRIIVSMHLGRIFLSNAIGMVSSSHDLFFMADIISSISLFVISAKLVNFGT